MGPPRTPRRLTFERHLPSRAQVRPISAWSQTPKVPVTNNAIGRARVVARGGGLRVARELARSRTNPRNQTISDRLPVSCARSLKGSDCACNYEIRRSVQSGRFYPSASGTPPGASSRQTRTAGSHSSETIVAPSVRRTGSRLVLLCTSGKVQLFHSAIWIQETDTRIARICSRL